MKAMVLERLRESLVLETRPVPEPGPGQVLLRVEACAVCRTDLHLMDGELEDAALPIVPGHQIVGRVMECGQGVEAHQRGDRVGVTWLGWACGLCPFCRTERENLCERARFTGCQLDGGFAEHAVADARFCFRLGEGDAAALAPLLCGGAIGYRALAMTGDAERVGLYGFGSAAHMVAQVARAEGRRVFAFTRPGDREAQRFAREVGAEWAGGSDQAPPEPLDAALLFAPVGALVPLALAAVRKAGVVVCAGIHMSDIPAFPYALLWGERVVRSVANLTRRDAEELLAVVQRFPVRTHVTRFALEQANEALSSLRNGEVLGTAVLEIKASG